MSGELLQDVRVGLRGLRRAPAFTLLAVGTLALGIGATTAIFSVFNSVLLRPLAYERPEALVRIYESDRARGFLGAAVTGPEFAAWRERSRTFERLGAMITQNAVLTGFEEPDEIVAGAVSEGFFDVLGVRPAAGRAFGPADHRLDSPEVVLLSRGLAARRFGSDTAAPGRIITLNGVPRTVVGVMPDRGEWTRNVDVWAALPDVFAQYPPGSHLLAVVGRLRPGATLSSAGAELTAIGTAALASAPAGERGWVPELLPLQDAVVGSAGIAVAVLLGAVGFVLLIACANVASLTLVRAHGRQRELAVRAALGASRWRLVRALLAESALLGLAGAAGGVLVGSWGLDAIRSLAPGEVPRLDVAAVDLGALGFTIGVTVLAVALFGALPALRASRADLVPALREGAGASRRGRGRDVLVVAEIALALVLTAGAGLLLKSLERMQRVDLGYDPARVIALDLDLPARGPYAAERRRTQLVHEVEERVRAIPGVVAVGSTRALPLESGGPDQAFDIAGRPRAAAAQARPHAFFTAVSPGYLAAMGAHLVAGRELTPADDRSDAPWVVVVNETFARRWWERVSPVGARIRLDGGISVEIVGVVHDLRQRFLAEPARPAMFVPFAHAPNLDISIVVRALGDPYSLVPALHRAVWASDPDLPVEQWTMDELMRQATARPRFSATLLGVFAALAVTLAVIGVYGVVSFGVAQQRREIGVRMALGAARRDVVAMVLRHSAALAGAGVTIGLAGTVALTRLMSRLLFGVRPTDAATLALAAAAVALLAVAACLGPARRAAAVDPMVVLRSE